MRLLALAILFVALTCSAQQSVAPQFPTTSTIPRAQAANSHNSTLTIPAGTQVLLALVRPLMTRTAKSGDAVYAETAFPVTAEGRMTIPPGTYIEGAIDSVTHPGLFSPHAQLQIHFTKLIFVNGYSVVLPTAPRPSDAQPPTEASSVSAVPDDVIPAVSTPYVDVSSRSEVLLDNGTQITMVLQLPLMLDADRVADAARQTKPGPPKFNSATQCRSVPATPGTPDTVIPGTPGTLGTPDTVIPGAPGQPDIVIPGTPASPGTPDTVIPGTPGTPEFSCPALPLVTSAPNNQNQQEVFQIDAPAQVGGKQLPAGTYEITWTGMGPTTQAVIQQNKAQVANAAARVVWLNRKPQADTALTHKNSEGSLSLDSLRFTGESFALYFD
jgi:hypothetical protein